jgi:hypothetical protein
MAAKVQFALLAYFSKEKKACSPLGTVLAYYQINSVKVQS